MASAIYKWLIASLLIFSGLGAVRHPLHIGVVEINHNAKDKSLEISCKLFTDDFERVLGQNYKTRADLYNPAEKKAMDKIVSDYITQHLNLKVDDKTLSFSYLGFEKQDDVTYVYAEIDEVPGVKKVEVNDKLMQDLFTDQISLIHVIVNGNRKTTKLTYPATQAVFSW